MQLPGSHPGAAAARPTPGGSYRTPPPEQLPECQAALGSRGEFIVDVHTHHVMPSLPWRTTAPDTLRLVLDMVPPDCTAANPLTCVDRAAYLHDMFLASDTTVALLSDLPSTGESNDPLPFSAADDTWQLASSLTQGGQSRLLLQNVVAPNFGSLAERLDGMTATAETRRVSAFKVYTAWGPGGRGFDLDDPAVGLPVVQHAHDLGVNVMCAHKGLPLLNFESTWNQPRDMVAVSRQFSDMQFVVYHAGWTPQHIEGPYNPADPVGVDSLIWALDRYQVPPNSNVWADLATVWRSLLADPVQAAHVLGKLLSRLGEDRVLWGTDSVWYGPPQTQIMAFRAFEISAEFQQPVRLPGPDRRGQGEGPRPERRPVVGPGPARHPVRAGRRHPFAQPLPIARAGRCGRAAGALGTPRAGHPRADPALAGPPARPLDTRMTRRRRADGPRGRPGGGTRTNGQAEVLAFPQASLPACIRPRISGRDAPYAVVPSRVQDCTGRGSGAQRSDGLRTAARLSCAAVSRAESATLRWNETPAMLLSVVEAGYRITIRIRLAFWR